MNDEECIHALTIKTCTICNGREQRERKQRELAAKLNRWPRPKSQPEGSRWNEVEEARQLHSLRMFETEPRGKLYLNDNDKYRK